MLLAGLCGSGEKTAEHSLLSCPRWAVEHQRHFSDSIDIKGVFQDYMNLVEFLISSAHLPLHVGIAHHDNNNISYHIIYHIISYHIVNLKRQNHLKVGTDKPKLKVKMQSVSDDDVRKTLLEKPHFELAAKCYSYWEGVNLPAGHSRSLYQHLGKFGYRQLIA